MSILAIFKPHYAAKILIPSEIDDPLLYHKYPFRTNPFAKKNNSIDNQIILLTKPSMVTNK